MSSNKPVHTNQTIQQQLDAEKRRANIWMAIAIVAMVIGLLLIGVAIIIAFKKKQCPVCPSALELCAVSVDELKRLGAAKKVVYAYENKLQELAEQGVGTESLAVFKKTGGKLSSSPNKIGLGGNKRTNTQGNDLDRIPSDIKNMFNRNK